MTICKFRHQLERYNMVNRRFPLIAEYLQESGLKVRNGTNTDANIISAPSSAKKMDRNSVSIGEISGLAGSNRENFEILRLMR